MADNWNSNLENRITHASIFARFLEDNLNNRKHKETRLDRKILGSPEKFDSVKLVS